MTEYYSEQPVDARPLLLVLPRSLVSPDPGIVVNQHPHDFVPHMRSDIRSRAGQEPPADNLAETWGLDEHEQALATEEVSRFMAAQPPESLETLLASAYPADAATQTRARANLLELLHEAARELVLVPRRHMYREFQLKSGLVLHRALGQTATEQLLAGEPVETSHYKFLRTSNELLNMEVPRLPEVSSLPDAEQRAATQQVIGEAFALSQVFLRHAPEYLADESAWPTGMSDLARRVLYHNVANLRYALITMPSVDARALIAGFLENHYFGDTVHRITGRRLDFVGLHNDERQVQEHRQELEVLLADQSVHGELHTAEPGDVIELAPPGETLSKATFTDILTKNLRALGLQKYLEAAELRGVLRIAMPRFSDAWDHPKKSPAEKLLGDFYGNVRNPRLVVLPSDQDFLERHFRSYANSVSSLDGKRFSRFALVVELKSSSPWAGQLTRVIEVSIYPNHYGGEGETICRSTRDRRKGAQAVLDLWQMSAAYATALEIYRMQHALPGGKVGGSGAKGRKGGNR